MNKKDLQNFKESSNRQEPYKLGPDSKKQEGVPEGEITKYHYVNKRIYAGTERDFWLYVPQQYDSSQPACLMIFQDGWTYLGTDVQANYVFDNLIHHGEIPVTIGLFIEPGDKGTERSDIGEQDDRSFEYNANDDLYARFLIEEIIPEISEKYNISDNPEDRTLVGVSSGGFCAVNAVWQRPDAFGNAISHCGSFVNMRGGDRLPEMIRRNPGKTIRIFLQSGKRDLDLIWGHWPTRNKEMATALSYSEYDHLFVFGEGGHTLMHGGEIFPDTLRWLRRK